MAFDSASSSQAARLKNHIITDPSSLGLSFMKTNGANARLLESESTLTGPTMMVTALGMQSVVDGEEIVALGVSEHRAWQTLIIAASAEGADLNSMGVDSQVSAIWSTGSDTFAALAVLKTKDAITYSEDLFGVGTVLTKRDIGAARALLSTSS